MDEKLDIPQEKLQYISKEKDYEVYFEQLGYNLFKIKTIGNLKVEYANSVKIIIKHILSESDKEHPNQKIYFINDILELKKFKLEAINDIFSTIKKISNIGGILIVSKNSLVKIALTASSHLIKEFLLKFFSSIQDALDYHQAFLAINLEYINNHFTKSDNKYTQTLEFKDSTSKFYLEFDGHDIITTKPLGVADALGINLAFEKFDKEIYPKILNGKKYYRIHDFTNYETSSGSASTVFIKWVKEHLHEIHLLIFCGLNKKNSILIKLGKLLFKDKHKILIVDTLEDAYNTIYKHKNKLKINTHSKEETEIELPETNEELKQLTKFLLQENKELKSIITKSSKELFNLFSEMTWSKDRLKEFNFEEQNIPEPFAHLIDTINVIYNDLQELIRSRDEEHNKNKLIEERYRKIMQVIPKVAIRGYYKNLEIFFWNNAGEEIFGIPYYEAIGKNLKDIYIYQNGVELIENAVNKAVENKTTGEFLKSGQQIIYEKNNKKIVIYSIHTSLLDNEGEQIFFSLDFDLTKQHEIEEELIKHKENLEELVNEKVFQLEIEKNKAQEADRLKSAFLANMSHEIRSPMNSIIGFSDLLENENLSIDKRKKFIDIIKTSGNNLLNIINDIVDISKIEAEQVNLNKENLVLNEVFSYLKKEFTPVIEKKPELIFKIKTCEEDNKIILFSDVLRIKQILTNLIGNAIKFTHKGHVELSYKIHNDSKVRICISDTGIGLEQEQIKHIFNRFRQADEKIAQEYGGTGLGLTISKKLAELLGGQILVESKITKGSTFILELPYDNNILEKPKDTNSDSISISKKENASLKGKNILLVEDDLSSALLIIELIEAKGINIELFNNGQDAIKYFDKNIDLVLLDIQLPDINGYEILKQLREKNKDIPIIAQTAFAMLNERKKILNSGFNDYLSKPIRKKELYNLLEQYLITQNN